jgi:hypothetical protein
MKRILKSAMIALIIGAVSANAALAIEDRGDGCGCMICPIIKR